MTASLVPVHLPGHAGSGMVIWIGATICALHKNAQTGIISNQCRIFVQLVEAAKVEMSLIESGSSWVSGCWRRNARGATIGPMSDGRLWLSSMAFGCCNGRHRPSAGTDHDFAGEFSKTDGNGEGLTGASN